MYVLFVVAAIMVMINGPVQARRLDTRAKTEQFRLAKSNMDNAQVELQRLLDSHPGYKVNRQIREMTMKIDSLNAAAKKSDSASTQFLVIQNKLYNYKVILADLKSRDNTPQEIKDQIWARSRELKKFSAVYDSLLLDAMRNPERYNQLSRRELNENLRFNVIRRNNLIYDLEKDETIQAIASGDEDLDLVHKRLRGVVLNKYSVPVTFWFQALDGGRDESIVVDPESAYAKSTGWAKQWLIEGTYLVHYSNGGHEICEPRIVHVGLHKTSIEVSVPVDPNALYWSFRTERLNPYWQANMPGIF